MKPTGAQAMARDGPPVFLGAVRIRGDDGKLLQCRRSEWPKNGDGPDHWDRYKEMVYRERRMERAEKNKEKQRRASINLATEAQWHIGLAVAALTLSGRIKTNSDVAEEMMDRQARRNWVNEWPKKEGKKRAAAVFRVVTDLANADEAILQKVTEILAAAR